METKLTEQESMKIINEMILQARNNIQKGSANSMIYSGYAVAFIAILNVILSKVSPEFDSKWTSLVWCLMIPFFFIDYYVKKRVDRSRIVKTHLDSILSTLGTGMLISVAVLMPIFFSLAFIFNNDSFFIVIIPIVMTMIAFSELVTAKVYRFKPFFWGAVVFWSGALLCGLSFIALKRLDIQLLILAVSMILGFVIPGYKLNKSAKENV